MCSAGFVTHVGEFLGGFGQILDNFEQFSPFDLGHEKQFLMAIVNWGTDSVVSFVPASHADFFGHWQELT